MVKEEPVFRIEYRCTNCGKKFSEKYYKGDNVTNIGWDNKIKLYSHLCDGSISCPHCMIIKCPNCESDNIEIEKREVL